MNLQDLVYFNHLAESLNFTSTAEHFYVSQPTISMSLKRLETEYDTILINRKQFQDKLGLTDTGKILYRHTKRILNELEIVKNEIYDLKNEIVYFGFLPTIGGYFFSKLMPHLEEYASSIKFIEEESSNIMLDLVRNGDVPIAIVGSSKPDFEDENLLQIPLTTEEFSLWVSKSNPLAGKGRINIKELKNPTFISLSQQYTHGNIFEDWIYKNCKEKPQTLYTEEIQTAISIASSSNMMAFMIPILANENNNLVEVKLHNGPKFYISLIVNKEEPHTYFQKTFNERLIDLVQTIHTEGNITGKKN